MGISGGDSRARIMSDGNLGARRHGVRIEGDSLGGRDNSEGKYGNQGTYRQLFHHENILASPWVLRSGFYEQHSPDNEHHAQRF